MNKRKLGSIELYMALSHKLHHGTTQGGNSIVIDGSISEEQLNRAAKFVFDSYGLLRSTIKKQQNDYCFVEDATFADVAIEHIVEAINCSAHESLLAEAVCKPIDETKSLWRIKSIKSTQNDQQVILFVFVHAIIDMDSFLLIADKFFRAVDDFSSGEVLALRSMGIAPAVDNYLRDDTPTSGEKLAYSALDHDCKVAIDSRSMATEVLSFDKCYLDRICAANNIKLNALISSALCLAAFQALEIEGAIPFKSAVSLRNFVKDGSGNHLGCFMGIAETPLDCEGKDLVTLAKEYDALLMFDIMRRVSCRSLLPTALAERHIGGQQDGSQFDQGFGITNIGEVTLQRDYKHFHISGFGSMANRLLGSAMFVAHVYEFDGVINVGFVYTRPLISEQKIKRIAEQFRSIVDLNGVSTKRVNIMDQAQKSKIEPIGNKISTLSNDIAGLQAEDGTIKREQETAISLLREVITQIEQLGEALGQAAYSRSITLDIETWIAAGVDQAPCFINTRDHFVVPEDKQWAFFFGPYKLANSAREKAYKMEFYLTYRDEPDACKAVYKKYPHPKNICLSTRILTGSNGFVTGNCVVFFPENIKCSIKVEAQKYALFFFNKFEKIYQTITLPTVRKYLGGKDRMFDEEQWISGRLDTKAFYEARCIWGYFHDFLHHLGPRPFDENIHLKMNWYAGLLEEIKVDSQVILLLLDDEKIPYAREVIQFVLLDRLFRYPQQPDAENNFDSGTGIFLLEWLTTEQALVINDRHFSVHMNWSMIVDALNKLVDSIVELEGLEDAAYLEGSKAFVEQFIGLADATRSYVFSANHEKLYTTQYYHDINFGQVAVY